MKGDCLIVVLISDGGGESEAVSGLFDEKFPLGVVIKLFILFKKIFRRLLHSISFLLETAYGKSTFSLK